MSSISTDLGDVVVRVRRFEALYHIGGCVHPVPGVRIEVAINAPATDGFEIQEPHYLDGRWRQPADDLAVHIEFGARVAEVAEREQSRRASDRPSRAADRPAVARHVRRPDLPSAPGREEPVYPRPVPPPARPGRLRIVTATSPREAA